MPDPFESEVNYPPHQKSREPEYKDISFKGCLQDDDGDWFNYDFTGAYYYFEMTFHLVEATVETRRLMPCVIESLDLQYIISQAIREKLGLSNRESIIFESKIELK